MKEIRLSNKVYKKNFSLKAYGYDTLEVDTFLDEVNLEIFELEKKIENLIIENESLKRDKILVETTNNDLRKENFKLKTSNTVNQNQVSNFSNIDILNKIANIETLIQEINNKMDKKE